MELLWPLTYWHWWVLATALIVAELTMPGMYLLWLGIAAAVTGAVTAAVGFGWQGQVVTFSLLSILSAAAGRMVYLRIMKPTDHPMLNRRAAQYIGQVFTLDQPIVHGAGRLKVADTTWKVVGPDRPAGSRVKVVAVDGVVLQVDPVEELTGNAGHRTLT